MLGRRARGFTLVEIMVVVIILGILAAIVIAAFTNVTGDARVNSTLRQLQVVRSWTQLYKFDHNDTLPDLITNQWAPFIQATDIDGTLGVNGTFGPYGQQTPVNPLNGNAVVSDSPSGPTVGWVYNATSGTIQATNQTPTILFDESTGAIQ
jgi:prepilin-type N-terminal cleavage/methylation domain-containing protein